jgi:hypothetical protein
MPNLYFCILWDLGVTYYILVRPGRETLTHYSSFSGGSGQICQKARQDMLRRNGIFAFGGICWSRRAFRCIRGVKRRCTIFHAQVGPLQFP